MRTIVTECLHHIADRDALAALVKLDELESDELASEIRILASPIAQKSEIEITKSLAIMGMASDKRAIRNVKRRYLAALLHKAGIIDISDSRGMKFKIMAKLAENYLKGVVR